MKKDIFNNDRTDNPKLKYKILKDGRYSIYLEYYFGDFAQDNGERKQERKKEFLSLYYNPNAKTPQEKQHNKDIIRKSKEIQYEKCQQMLENKEGYRLQQRSEDFLRYFQRFIDKRKNNDVKIFKSALSAFKDFLNRHYPQFRQSLPIKRLSPSLIEDFTEYLKEMRKGSGAVTAYKRFKQVVNKCVKEKHIAGNPCEGITISANDDIMVKDILSQEEIQKLFACHYSRENTEIRKAFAFSLLTGARFCDTSTLTYDNIDISSNMIKFHQKKVSSHSNNSGVTIYLTDNLKDIIGDKPEDAKGTDLLFNLPSHTMCSKALRRWTKEAGINKHITWHCARHSFATNLLLNNANIVTVKELLGHSNLKYTMVYARATDAAKMNAIASQPTISL